MSCKVILTFPSSSELDLKHYSLLSEILLHSITNVAHQKLSELIGYKKFYLGDNTVHLTDLQLDDMDLLSNKLGRRSIVFVNNYNNIYSNNFSAVAHLLSYHNWMKIKSTEFIDSLSDHDRIRSLHMWCSMNNIINSMYFVK